MNKEEGNFQTMNVIQKLKRIHKAKKRIKHNYKNIETIDVLSNHGEPLIEGFGKGQKDPSLNDTTCRNDPDYEGCDALPPPATKKNPLEGLVAFIEGVYTLFDSVLSILAFTTALGILSFNDEKQIIFNELTNLPIPKVTLSPKNRTALEETYNNMFSWTSFDDSATVYQLITVPEKTALPSIHDFQIIKTHLEWFAAVTVSCYFVYNWYFLLVYEDPVRFKNGPDTFDTSMDAMHERASQNPLFNFFIVFFSSSWIFVSVLDQYMIKGPIKYLLHYMNATLCFCIIFIACIYLTYYSPHFLKTFLIDCLLFNFKNKWLIVMTTLAMFYYMISILDPNNPIPWFGIFSMSVIFGIILVILLGMFIGMFAAPVAGLFMFTFFFSYSFFAIFIYGLSNVRNISSLFLSIREHARMTKNKIRKGTDVLPNTPFERFWLAINEIVDFIYIYIFYIAYIIILIYAGSDYQKHVESAGLKTGLIALTAMLIFMFVVLCISDFYMRYKDITNPLIAAVTPVIPAVNPIHEKENSITNLGQVLKSKDVKEKLDQLSNQVNSTLSTSSNFFSKISSDLASNLKTGLEKMMPSAEGVGKAFTQQKKV